jgi:hypothetical protein
LIYPFPPLLDFDFNRLLSPFDLSRLRSASRKLMCKLAIVDNMSRDRDDEETTLPSSHREWAEDQERRRQEQDQRAVERFLRSKLQLKTQG